MTVLRAVKVLAGLVAVGVLLLLASIFVADNQLSSPFDDVELGPIELPVADPLVEGVLLHNHNRTGNHEIYGLAPGGAEMALTNDPRFDSWRPRLSPDRTRVLFYRTPAGVGDTDPSQASLWMVGANGLGLVEVLPVGAHGWASQGDASWSPLGDELVMTGGRASGSQVWVTSIDGRDVRSVVSEAGDNADPSWSPDAKRILYVACPEHPCTPSAREVYAVLSVGGDRTRLTSDLQEDAAPHFSPDGQQIAVATEMEAGVWDIRVFPTNNSQRPRPLQTNGVSGAPQWADNRTVLFHSSDTSGAPRSIFSASVTEDLLTVVRGTQFDEAYPSR